MNSDSITNLLLAILAFFIILLFVLAIVWIFLRLKTKSKKTEKTNNAVQSDKKSSKISQDYNMQSIFEFMEFENVQDNMIIQNKGKRFLMVVECQGINYDLMSQLEKVGVEEGFLAFLNTLRHPIQLYVQTRTINLDASLASYNQKVNEIELKLNNMKAQYEFMRESNQYSKQDLDKALFEITKQTNLYEYAKDVIVNTERLSKNKNILNKKYYIIIPYYFEESTEKYDAEEIKSMAFSELYTRAQAVIRTLSATGVNGKILNSNELAELLYIAYNRDEAEVFNLQDAIRAGCDDMYTTGKDVLDKKIQALDKEIEKKAFEKAKDSIEEAREELQKEKEAREKQENMESLINMMAEMMLENNKQYIGEEITEKAKDIVNKPEEKEEEVNVQKKTTKRASRTRTKKS